MIPHWWRELYRHRNNLKYKYNYKRLDKSMKINIIAPESSSGWILYKFGKSMYDELQKLGYDVTLSKLYDDDADINHSFFANYIEKSNPRSSFMVTHVNSVGELENIRRITNNGSIAVCMSRDTRDFLITSGVDRSKVCYVNPAQDGMLLPKKISLGFTHRVYNDNRKRESMLVDICRELDSSAFKISIMGAGWEEVLKPIQEMGFEVLYYKDFDKDIYNDLMHSIDYYCYFGFDEGSMGYLDAVAAGVKTIVTPQGYHLDSNCPITYPVRNIAEILDVLLTLQKFRNQHIEFAKTWTWKNYALKHIEIWKYMLGCEELSSLLETRGWYNDGIYSLFLKREKQEISLHKKITDSLKNNFIKK